MGHNNVVSGYPKSTEFSWVDGLLTGPPGFGASHERSPKFIKRIY